MDSKRNLISRICFSQFAVSLLSVRRSLYVILSLSAVRLQFPRVQIRRKWIARCAGENLETMESQLCKARGEHS